MFQNYPESEISHFSIKLIEYANFSTFEQIRISAWMLREDKEQNRKGIVMKKYA
jgi:hypothetical protein